MSVYFFDTSALAKRYLNERGSHWVRGLFQTYPTPIFAISAITPTELVSVVARNWRFGQINQHRVHLAMLLLENHRDRDYTFVDYSKEVEDIAHDLLLRYPLRAADAMQLASTVFMHRNLAGRQTFTFVCADVRLHAAAIQEGLTVDDPNNHP